MKKISFTPFLLLTTKMRTLPQLMIADNKEIFILRSINEMNGFLDRQFAKTIEAEKHQIGINIA